MSLCIGIQEQTHVAEGRRAAMRLASELSLDEAAANNLGLVVTEAARNVLKHAGGGKLLLHSVERNGARGIEILAVDNGPGIPDLDRCYQDGYSTAGTPGTGLGAIARLSGRHEIYSRRDQGTVLMAQVWKMNGVRGVQPALSRFCAGAVSVPFPGETECGDDWIFQEFGSSARLTVVDGLGHGLHAAEAARLAIQTARAQGDQPAASLLDRIHQALRPTRGAAVAIAQIDSPAHVVRFAGLGNIGAAILPQTGPVRRCVSNPGTAGHSAHKMLEFNYPWDSQSLLLMHSDGLQSHWSFDPYPGLRERHPSLIAGVFFRDYARGRDDVTVVAAREKRVQS